MAVSMQITLIICITFIILNLIWFREAKLREEVKSISTPKFILPPWAEGAKSYIDVIQDR